MPVVSAGPGQYLLVGRGGRLENRGSAVRAMLLPGTIYTLVPSTKQEATFEFTQETRDGIPLRFKGIIVYRITDPVAAARLFEFGAGSGPDRITALLTHVCLGELRDAVSRMTMTECIEGRKTTLSGVAGTALEAATRGDGDGTSWGITVEVAQLSQVFIVDADLRRQLEAEVRNEIKLKSDRSDLRAQEQAHLEAMASADRVEEQKLAGDREQLRRQEALELAELARRRRREAEDLATARQTFELGQERFRAEMAAEQDRVEAEAPVRRLRAETERALLTGELELRRLQNEVKGLEAEAELLLPRARQELRLELLPVEQAPAIVEAASKVFQGTSLSIYGDGAQLVGQLAPVLDVLARAVGRATAGVVEGAPGAGEAASDHAGPS